VIKIVLHKVFFQQIISYLSRTKRMTWLCPKRKFFSLFFCPFECPVGIDCLCNVRDNKRFSIGLWVIQSLSEWSASKQRVQSVCHWYQDRTWICLRAIIFACNVKIDRGFYQTGRLLHYYIVKKHCVSLQGLFIFGLYLDNMLDSQTYRYVW
jgi:hypothetical protein